MKKKSVAKFKTPILFTIYNRLETTKIVFDVIKKIKPTHLYIASDGPKNENDISNVKKVREYVINNIDWDVNLKTKFYKVNKGCGRAMSSSVDWFFNNVDKGIILEDDCLPSLTFFNYCEVLLNHHADNKNIWHISGAVMHKQKNYNPSYYYSVYPGMWGWATWSNRWKEYKFDMNEIDLNLKNYKYFNSRSISRSFFNKIKKRMENNEIDTWDYQWIFTIWQNNALCVTPNYNLVSNIGFSEDATHTININDSRSNNRKVEIESIIHPKKVDIFNDELLKKKYYSSPSFLKKVINKFNKW
mgnify:CR=1 FL=1